MHLENMVITVGKSVLYGFSARRAGIDDLRGEKLIAFGSCGFLDGHIGIDRKISKSNFTIPIGRSLFLFRSISNLKCASSQPCTVFIGFKYLEIYVLR